MGQYGIGEDEVRLTAMAPHSKKAALLSGKVDYINGFINGDYLAVRLEDSTILEKYYTNEYIEWR